MTWIYCTNIIVDWNEESKLDLSQLEDVYEVNLFQNVAGNKS